ncbi:MAG: TIM barrel protein [Actinomycetota bacterium]
MPRLLSIAAGVTPELAADPAGFVECAAEAGWSATGVWFDPDSWTDRTTTDVLRRLDASGLLAVDMEVIRMGPKGDCGDRLIDAAAEIGAANVLAISSFDDPGETAVRFGELCERAAPAGVRICLEFMRFTQVRSLADALQIIERADQPNAGILVDLLHVVRSGTSLAEVASADPELFPYAQWCDGPAEPRGWDTRDLITDALDDRSIPGQGALPVTEFEGLFADDVPFSLEVRSRALREAFPDPIERARDLLARTRAALAG